MDFEEMMDKINTVANRKNKTGCIYYLHLNAKCENDLLVDILPIHNKQKYQNKEHRKMSTDRGYVHLIHTIISNSKDKAKFYKRIKNIYGSEYTILPKYPILFSKKGKVKDLLKMLNDI